MIKEHLLEGRSELRLERSALDRLAILTYIFYLSNSWKTYRYLKKKKLSINILKLISAERHFFQLI